MTMSDTAPAISISTMSAADADSAFGLARLAFPDLTPTRWRQLVKRWTGAGRAAAGALLARDGAGRIVGFAPYEVRTDLCPGRTLWVERVVAVSLIDAGPALRALAAGLSDMARRVGCQRLKVETAPADRALRQVLSRSAGTIRSTVLQATV